MNCFSLCLYAYKNMGVNNSSIQPSPTAISLPIRSGLFHPRAEKHFLAPQHPSILSDDLLPMHHLILLLCSLPFFIPAGSIEEKEIFFSPLQLCVFDPWILYLVSLVLLAVTATADRHATPLRITSAS